MERYFAHADGAVMRYVYAPPMEAVSEFVLDLPQGTTVYFYSSRWGFDYETRRYIAPDATGVDRSREFRGDVSDAPIDFSIDAEGDVAFVLLDEYLASRASLETLCPDEQLTDHRRGGELLFSARYLPR